MADNIEMTKERILKGEGTWVLEKEFGTEGEGKMEWAYGIGQCPNQDIVVTRSSEEKVTVFDSDGKFKQSLHGGDLDWVHGVAVSLDGTFFIADDTACVKVFSPEGEYMRQFPAKSPNGKLSDADGRCTLISVTIDSEGCVWVGASKRYISKHTQDGTHISSVKTNKPPAFITVTSKGRIIFSPENGLTGAQILDHTGNRLAVINAPKDVENWNPSGVCSIDDDVFFINSWSDGDTSGIYSFTTDGEYLGCVTTNIFEAFGIALTKDYKLLVAEFRGYPVKVFSNIAAES